MIDIKLANADCLDMMKSIEDNSIDMILCDLPYGTTACKWDVIIPFEPLWEQYERISKDDSAISLNCSEPFTSFLIVSNIKMFKYKLIWDKMRAVGAHVSKYRPLQLTEDICIFGKGTIKYIPQMEPMKKSRTRGKEYGRTELIGGNTTEMPEKIYTEYHPTNLITFSNASNKNRLHPTQKPVALLEYLIKTYTNEGDTVLDNCMGSGSTCIACINTNRNFIGVEKDKEYFDKAYKRIQDRLNES